MSNSIPASALYLENMRIQMALSGGMVAGRFDGSGNQMAAEKGSNFNIEVLGYDDANGLDINGTVVLTDVDSRNVNLTLLGYQKTYAMSEQEIQNTVHDVAASSRKNAGFIVMRGVEAAVSDMLNTTVSRYKGDIANSIIDGSAINEATGLLGSLEVPGEFRTLALSPTSFAHILNTPEDNFADKTVMQPGMISPVQKTISALYTAKTRINPAFGAGAFSVSGTVAAGLSTIIIAGSAFSLTPALIAGSMIDIAHSNGITESYTITADANSDGAGLVTVLLSRALVYEATAADVITFATGNGGTSFTKNYLFQQEYAVEGSRQVAPNTVDIQSQLLPQNWFLSSKASSQPTTWGQWYLGAAALYGITQMRPDYACVILSKD